MEVNNSRIRKKAINFNLTTIFFIAVSFISITFAWIAYNNAINSSMQIAIRSWNVVITQDQTEISNQIAVSLDSFYPGMDTYEDTITISNNGDVDAILDYEVSYLRIFDTVYTTSGSVSLDSLAHDYPFAFNFSSDTTYIAVGSTAQFSLSISWPLDSIDNSQDTYYGNQAYTFSQNELAMQSSNPSYEIRSEIEIVLDLVVKQYVNETDYTDLDYVPGSLKYYRSNFTQCETLASGCSEYYVISNTLLGDSNVTIMTPASAGGSVATYSQSATYPSTVLITQFVGRDIFDTVYKVPDASERLVGNISSAKATELLNFIAANDGYISFNSSTFSFLSSGTCYWTNMAYGSSTTKVWAIKNSGGTTKLYGENKTTSCKNVTTATIAK